MHTIIDTLITGDYKLPQQHSPSFIIDGGAFIGDSSIYFLNRFPQCGVVALEPNPDNYILAKSNLAHYGGRVALLQRGLWHCKTKLRITDDNLGARLVNDDELGFACECIDINSILAEYGKTEIDLLKLNIEGAELPVITENSAWLSKTKLIVVQFHGYELENKCNRYLVESGFQGYIYRTFYYYINKTYA